MDIENYKKIIEQKNLQLKGYADLMREVEHQSICKYGNKQNQENPSDTELRQSIPNEDLPYTQTEDSPNSA